MRSRLPFIFITVTVMLDAMGIGLIMPVMPDLIKELQGETISAAAIVGGFLAFTYSIMQFLCAPMLGNLSDAYGRRVILLGSLVAMGVDYFLMAVAGSLWLLFVARFISGVTGATYSTAAAYLADISKPEDRAANFGLIGAAFGLGFILGPAIGGLLGEYGTRAPFIAAGIFALINAAFGWFAIPETLAAANRRPFEWSRANPFRALLRLREIPAVGGLVLVMFVYTIANYVYPAVWSFFGIERFGWSARTVGLSLAFYGLMAAIVQGVLIRPILRRLGERRTAMAGFLITALGMTILAFIRDGFWVFALMPITALGVIVGPALQGMSANRVSDSEQGELQGVISSVNGIAMIISPLVMTGLFRFFTREGAEIYLPGAPFLLGALLTLVSMALLMGIRRLR
jgi:MFS transporter, DHA1 family, tetracycline resistance protein